MRDKNKVEKYQNDQLSLLRLAANGDESGLIKVFDASPMAPFAQHTIFARNESIAEKISELLKNSPKSVPFIALGAAHLFGENGVIQRLKNSGFETRRLCN